MKLVFVFLLGLFGYGAWGDEVKIEINPNKPVAGESFQAYFRVFTDSEEEPIINFSPNNLEVVGKSNQGISTRTIYANGKLTVSREITIVYDLVASRPGFAGIRDINIQLGSQNLRHPTVSLTVLKEPEVLADVFVMADVPKKSIFLGEGVTVRYYLYSKVPVSNLEVKKYPKLNNFLKRFLQEPDRSERVSVDGQIYMRNQIYGAKLFPEKTGELKIDSLQLSATFMVSRGIDPFGSLGFGRDLKTKSISSENVKIDVKPLPEQGKPSHFTGLVGKHDFEIQFGNNKLIVNEPLEVKLTVTGGGALENLEAPTIISHSGLEEFESNGDLKIMDAEQATKVFDYTFLAKENLRMPPSQMTVSYFDPDSLKYVPIQLSLPEIVVAGATGKSKKETKTMHIDESPLKPEEFEEKNSLPRTLSSPLLDDVMSFRGWLPMFNLALGALALLLALGWMIKTRPIHLFSSAVHIPSPFKKGEFSLSEFMKWVSPLVQKTGKSPVVLIKDSSLNEETKAYFIDLLNANDYKDYSTQKGQAKYVYRSQYFKELGRYIESVKNENPPQPS